MNDISLPPSLKLSRTRKLRITSKIITVLGAGAFGTSVAQLLADNGYQVKLWSYESQVVQDITKSCENKKYLDGVKLSSNIKPTSDLREALEGSKFVFEAIPVKFLRNILNQIKDFLSHEQILVVLSKGIEQETLLLPTQIIDDIFGKKLQKTVMAGPNFAKKKKKKCCTATVVCSQEKNITQELQKILTNDYFKTYPSDDIVGVQVGGAIKNVICLTAGFVHGSCFSQNSLAFLLTLGLEEMAKLSVCLGGKKDTVYGLAGFGDLVLSATGSLSRNLNAGKLIGQGKKVQDLQKEFGTLPEGINTVTSIYNLIKKCNLDLPICIGTYEVVFEGKSVKDFLKQIFV